MWRPAPDRIGPVFVLLLVCGVGLATRLLFAALLVPHLERAAHTAPDPDHYAELAASLLDRGELGFDPPGASPTSVRGPVFPAWLAVGMLVGGRSPGWIGFWASLPGLIAAATIATMLARSHGTVAALAGGSIAASHPLACFVSARDFPDEFYGTVLLLGLAAWYAAVGSARRGALVGWAVLAGALLSAALLTRVSALLVVALLLAMAVFSLTPWRIVAAIVLTSVAISAGAWGMRTTALVGHPVLVESLAGYNFWLGEANDRFGFAYGFGGTRERAHQLMTDEAGTQETAAPKFWYATLAPPLLHAFDETLARAARASIARRPLHFAKRCVAGVFWLFVRAESFGRTLQYAVVALPLVALSVFGLFSLARHPAPQALPAGPLALVFVFHVALYAAIVPMARYSVQLYPLMSYLAGIGLATATGAREGANR